MHSIVCVKQVLDPEAPPTSFTIDPTTNTLLASSQVAPVLDPYGEYAIEAALRIKDNLGGKITVLSLGANLPRHIVKRPLELGADELILLEDEDFSNGDSWSTSYPLAKAIRKLGTYDLILCGRQASDWDAGQVGLGIAEILEMPCISVAKNLEIADGKAIVKRVVDDGYEIVEVILPAVVTVTSELGELRYPKIKGILAAKKKEPIIWKPADIQVDPSQIGAAGRRAKILRLSQSIHESTCEMIEAGSFEEAGVNLATRLREVKIL